MKRSADNIPEKEDSPSPQKIARNALDDDDITTHHHYNREQNRKLMTQWISECDTLLGDCNAVYGEGKRQLLDLVIGRVCGFNCVSYYSFRPFEIGDDKNLCRNICPVFVLHGIADLLKSSPSKVKYVSYEWQFILHILKMRLVENGRSISQFVSRIIELVYSDGLVPYELEDVYKNIITVFHYENTSFLVKRDNQYILSTESIEDPVNGIRDIIVNNLLPPFYIVSESYNTVILESCRSAQNEAIALWNTFQLNRGTVRESPINMNTPLCLPKKKRRDELRRVHFSDDVITITYRRLQ